MPRCGRPSRTARSLTELGPAQALHDTRGGRRRRRPSCSPTTPPTSPVTRSSSTAASGSASRCTASPRHRRGDALSRRLTGVTGGEVVVAALALHDVGVVFGIPGTHNLSVFDALGAVRHPHRRHDARAGRRATPLTDTRAPRGRPGVAVVTSGPAVYNAATAVAQAYSDSIPVLLVSPGMPRDLPVGGPGSGYLHEAKDQTGAMDRIAARCIRVHHAPADRRRGGRGVHRVRHRTPATDPPRGAARPARRASATPRCGRGAGAPVGRADDAQVAARPRSCWRRHDAR